MPRYTEEEAREAIGISASYAEALRRLGLRAAGGNHRLFRHWVDEVWEIPTDHFDQDRALRALSGQRRMPLEEVLVEHSGYSRRALKNRLFETGLKARACELCGQGESWRGRTMGLILDHVNGVFDDNRLENLRIVCPNCNATLETHCGRHNRAAVAARSCAGCGAAFLPRASSQRYCSRRCGQRAPKSRTPKPAIRKVERPAYPELLTQLADSGYSALARRYGVSERAVRKWVRWYEAAEERRETG